MSRPNSEFDQAVLKIIKQLCVDMDIPLKLVFRGIDLEEKN